MRVVGVLGLIGAVLTLAGGVYPVLISGVLSGFASAEQFATARAILPPSDSQP